MPTIPGGLDLTTSQLKMGNGATQKSTGSLGSARASLYDGSGSTSPRPGIRQRRTDWIIPNAPRRKDGFIFTDSEYISTTNSVNKYDSQGNVYSSSVSSDSGQGSVYSSSVSSDSGQGSVYSLDSGFDPDDNISQFSNRRRSSIEDTETSDNNIIDEKTLSQQIITAYDEGEFQIENAVNVASQKRIQSQDEIITTEKLNLYRQSQEWDFHNKIANYIKEHSNIDHTKSEQLLEYIARETIADSLNADMIDEIKILINKKANPNINKIIRKASKKIKKLRTKITNKGDGWTNTRKQNLANEINIRTMKLDIYTTFKEKFNGFFSNPIRQDPGYSPNYDIETFHQAAKNYVTTDPNITLKQRTLIDQGFDMIKKGDEPIMGFNNLLPEEGKIATSSGAHGIIYSHEDISNVMELFQKWFTAAEYQPEINAEWILRKFNDRLRYIDNLFPSSIDNVAKSDDLYSPVRSTPSQLAQQNNAYKPTTLDNAYARVEDLPKNRDPSQLSYIIPYAEVDNAKIFPNRGLNAKLAFGGEYSRLISMSDELLNTDAATLGAMNELFDAINRSLADINVPSHKKYQLVDNQAALIEIKSISENDPSFANHIQRNVLGTEQLEELVPTPNSNLDEPIPYKQNSFNDSDHTNPIYKDMADQFNPKDISTPAPGKLPRSLSNNQNLLDPLSADALPSSHDSLVLATEGNSRLTKIRSSVKKAGDVSPNNLENLDRNVPVTPPLTLSRTKSGTLPFENPQVSALNSPSATEDALGSISLVTLTDNGLPLADNPTFRLMDKGIRISTEESAKTESLIGFSHHSDESVIVQSPYLKINFMDPEVPETLSLPSSNRGTPPTNFRARQDKDFLMIGSVDTLDADTIVTPRTQDQWTSQDRLLFKDQRVLLSQKRRMPSDNIKFDYINFLINKYRLTHILLMQQMISAFGLKRFMQIRRTIKDPRKEIIIDLFDRNIGQIRKTNPDTNKEIITELIDEDIGKIRRTIRDPNKEIITELIDRDIGPVSNRQ